MRVTLDRLVALENEEMWSVRKHPDADDDHLLTSMFHMDICTVRRRRSEFILLNIAIGISLKKIILISRTIVLNFML